MWDRGDGAGSLVEGMGQGLLLLQGCLAEVCWTDETSAVTAHVIRK